MGNLWLAFLTGLTTGGVSCLAVQGGLLASSITDTDNKKANTYQVLSFVISKLVAYTMLGGLLGYVGSLFILSPKIQAIIQIFIGIFLLGTAGRLLNIHPVFRYFAIQPPKQLFKIARKSAALEKSFAPILAGAATVLLPCGVTQAMMLTAIASGSILFGALTMFAFILGTTPVFFAVGMTTLEMLKKKSFSYIAAILVAIFGIISLNTSSVLLGSNHTIQNYWRVITGNEPEKKVLANKIDGLQEATIYVQNNGYRSDTTTLKVNIPVRLKLITDDTFSCSRAFTVPALGISKVLPTSGTEVIEFTPKKLGRLNYSCSMGMYVGSFDVIE